MVDYWLVKFLIVVVVSALTIPMIVYFTVKLGTFAFYVGRLRFYQRFFPKGKPNDGDDKSTTRTSQD